jgi:hypothetical protein
MSMTEKSEVEVQITEAMVERYFLLNSEAKRIEEELKQIKKHFHQYFDAKFGENEKGEASIGTFNIQRRIQLKRDYADDKTVQRLEDLQFTDCIRTVKTPDREKIDAAISLGLLASSDLTDCMVEKVTPSIWVKEKKE